MYFSEVKDKEELIYDLIFSEKLDYKINIADYVDDIYQYDDFVEDMKIILKKSKVNYLILLMQNINLFLR